MEYDEAIEWLYSTQQFGIKLGLDSVRRMLQASEVSVDDGPKFIHVAGTNGKGSVCAMIDSICRAGGYRTGLFTSPHLVSFRERIRLDGEMISETDVAAGLTRLRDLTARWPERPTFFEITCVLAFEYFSHAKARIVVLETGMGGRLDSTNVVKPLVSVITPIGDDHRRWLGDTLPDIAHEKAGIIKSGLPVISAMQAPEVEEVLKKVVLVRGSPLRFVKGEYPGAVALVGRHQRENAALAAEAVAAAGLEISRETVARGISETTWAGRFHEVRPGIILDGAHNPQAVATLMETWAEVHGDQKPTVILGVLEDKDLPAICRQLGKVAKRVLTVHVRSHRSADPERLRSIVAMTNRGMDVRCVGRLEDALAAARGFPEKVLVTGSLFLVGGALAHFAASEAPLPTVQ